MERVKNEVERIASGLVELKAAVFKHFQLNEDTIPEWVDADMSKYLDNTLALANTYYVLECEYLLLHNLLVDLIASVQSNEEASIYYTYKTKLDLLLIDAEGVLFYMLAILDDFFDAPDEEYEDVEDDEY